MQQQRKSLTPKQKAFVEAYALTRNAPEAARAAGYSRRAVLKVHQHIMTSPLVKAEIARIEAELNKRIAVDAAWVLNELVSLYGVTIADVEKALVEVGHDIAKLPRNIAKAVDSIETVTTTRGEQTTTNYKIKLVQRLRGIELIARHVDVDALVRPSLDVNVKVTINRAEEIQKMRQRARGVIDVTPLKAAS